MVATWQDQIENAGSAGEFYFKIDDNFYFLIDNTYQLIIQNTVGITWTDQNEN